MEHSIKNEKESTYSHAIVIGSGIAGLTAARVLHEYFAKVTVIERDRLPDIPDFRPGIPQALHAHTLLPYGQMLLEQLFPDLVNELMEQGAMLIDSERETAYFHEGVWRKPSPHQARPSITSSRPLLETSLSRRIAALPKISILQGVEVNHLLVDETGKFVTGVSLRNRVDGGNMEIKANLVVDASGRNSKAPEWLKSLGFVPPEEWRINAYAGYASRLYRQPENRQQDWKKLYVSPCPPEGTRGGIIIPLEGGRWQVTLIGISNDYPPTSEEGFLEFAQSLPTPDLYEAIRDAEPISRISGYRRNENQVRRYENLPRYLEGFLVTGDAVFTMNPVYALGMTAAAISSQVLEKTLQSRRGAPDLKGLAKAFQKQLAKEVSNLWHQAIQNEWHWPATNITDNTEQIYAQA